MHDNTSVSTHGSGRRKRGIILSLCLGAVVLTGLGAWALWPSEEPSVAVPDRVCAGALPGGPVRDLLPERGEAYTEDYLFGSYSATSVSTTWKCSLSGGGNSVHFSKFLILSEDDYSSQDIARDAAKPGNAPLSWGAGSGFVGTDRVSLFVGCKGSKGSPVLLETNVSVDRGDADPKDRAAQEEVVALAADFARFMTVRVDHCKAVELPDSAPKIG
ncbi:hypothetical protein JKV81_15680 [Streptomyces sp. For3]|uniref:hypothetical protein n=1 Tax=Streptomyces TaxID=1883 RepID=UPI00100F6FCA|nr:MULTISPECIES: hypothetical protein [Streptomyces]MBL1288268.1 hypothetical protein [Streptomyces silvae]